MRLEGAVLKIEKEGLGMLHTYQVHTVHLCNKLAKATKCVYEVNSLKTGSSCYSHMVFTNKKVINQVVVVHISRYYLAIALKLFIIIYGKIGHP